MKRQTKNIIKFVLFLIAVSSVVFIAVRLTFQTPEPNETEAVTAESEVPSEAPGVPSPQSAEEVGASLRLTPSPAEETVDSPSFAPVEESTSKLLDVPSYDQTELGYPLGCEIISLAMMISYSTQVDIDALVAEMPRADSPYEGYRGDPSSTNYGWTIFPEALSPLLEKHLGSAENLTGCDIEKLKEKLNEGIPVLAWVNGLGWPVHCICLSGYDESGFYYNDPASGEKDAFLTYEDFYLIWDKPIYDRFFDIYYPTKIALSY